MSSLFSRRRRLSALFADASAARTERFSANGRVLLPLCRLTRRSDRRWTLASIYELVQRPTCRDIRQMLGGLFPLRLFCWWTLASDHRGVDVNLLLRGLREPLV